MPQRIKNPIAPRKLSGSIQFQAITPEPIEIPIVTIHNSATKHLHCLNYSFLFDLVVNDFTPKSIAAIKSIGIHASLSPK